MLGVHFPALDAGDEMLTLSTAELVTGFCRVRFACSAFVTVFWRSTFRTWLFIQTKAAEIVVFSSYMVVSQHEQSTWMFLVISASSEGQLLTLDLGLFFLSFHVQFQG